MKQGINIMGILVEIVKMDSASINGLMEMFIKVNFVKICVKEKGK